ncbi:hypothetical protein [Roseateles koreensis]|uniref:Uncharacterized protein n=1 Tax=Roseateles koreensis TaxID=2987526 RepID=A0ABT5KQ14_9BURK|nr:hypothetical protein [Roseateles koreensis]MDC8785010.1 hypothetical protein [Roseateles koreensis]
MPHRRQALRFLWRAGLGVASLALGVQGAPAAERGPRQNLWIEIRWVNSSLSGAVLAGTRDGGVVVGTAGSVSPRGQISWSTQRHEDDATRHQTQRLLVLNGNTARLQLTEQVPIQWVDYGVEMDAAGAASAVSGRNNASPGGMAGAKVFAAPRSGTVDKVSEFRMTPRWPGGQQPVTVELQVQGAGNGGSNGNLQTRVDSTVSVPLGTWLTVARSGDALRASERGTLSSTDAEVRQVRELQLRVDLAP